MLSGIGAPVCSPALVSGIALWFGPGIATLTLLSALLPGLAQGIALETALGDCSLALLLALPSGLGFLIGPEIALAIVLRHRFSSIALPYGVSDYCLGLLSGLLSRITVSDYCLGLLRLWKFEF